MSTESLFANQSASASSSNQKWITWPTQGGSTFAFFESMSDVIVASQSGLKTEGLGHHSGRPAIRNDSARLAASPRLLNWGFAIKCAIEKSGFIARHSAALTLAWSMSASRAWQPAINAATLYVRPGEWSNAAKAS